MGWLVVFIVIIAGVIWLAVSFNRSTKDAVRIDAQRREDQLVPARALVLEDIAVLTAEAAALDGLMAARLDGPPDPDADHTTDLAAERADLARAREAVRAAGVRLDTATEIVATVGLLDNARFSTHALRARVEGRPTPVRRMACFFDPAHGQSDRDVSWAPDGGTPRPVPVCSADADRLDAGEPPAIRRVIRGVLPAPWWESGRAFAPYARGYFGLAPSLDWLVTGLDIAGYAGFAAPTPPPAAPLSEPPMTMEIPAELVADEHREGDVS